MNDFYKVYEITAEVKTPIFIGAGTTLSKKDYYVDDKEHKIYIVDVNKLIRRNSKILSLYEDYAKDITKTFNEWVENDSVKMYLNADIIKNDYTKYAVGIGDTDIRGGKQQISTNRKDNKTNNIDEFIKNAYNEPYIPGSSLKGAIRTAILSSELINSNDTKFKNNSMEQLLKVIEGMSDRTIKGYSAKNIEKQCFNKLDRTDKREDATNDIFSYISISDSDSIGLNSLVLCEKNDVDENGNERKSNLPLVRECVRPKTEIRFRINVQNNSKVYQIDNLLNRIKFYSDYYLKYFNKNFKLSLANYKGIYLPIGGGVGYISKTITDEVASDGKGAYYISQILGNIFRNHKHFNDYKKGFAPRLEKSTKYEDQLVPMGLLEIKKIFEPKTNNFILNN